MTHITTTTHHVPHRIGIERIKQLVVNAVDSENTKVAYAIALDEFFEWWHQNGSPTITKHVVRQYVEALRSKGLKPSTINLKISAIRKMINEGVDNGYLDPQRASGILKVKGLRVSGTRLGRWLQKHEAQALISAPDPATTRGLRDRVILALLIGCGLRREEIVRLRFDQIEQREGRWVIVDLVGKGGKMRSVPMPSWAKAAVDQWRDHGMKAAPHLDWNGNVVKPINKAGHITGDKSHAQTVWYVVHEYAQTVLGREVAPHDLRRTYAHLAHKGGAPLEQIQLSLGHSSIRTTEIYLGVKQDLTNAPCDMLGLHL